DFDVRAVDARRVGGDGRGRVVYFNRLGFLVIRQSLRARIGRAIRRDDFEDIAPVGQRVGVDGVIVFAQLGFERVEFAAATGCGGVIDRIFNRVAVLTLRLPLQRDRAALEDAAGRNLRHHAQD